MKLIEEAEKAKMKKKKIPAFRVGDMIRVMVRVKEGDKERIQPFDGVVIRLRKSGIRTSFTMRKISYGVGVERIFPMYSPVIAAIEVKTRGEVARSKLYYLRKLAGKAARVKEGEQVTSPIESEVEAEEAANEVPTVEKQDTAAHEEVTEEDVAVKAVASQEVR